MSIIRNKQVDVSSDFDFQNHKLINLLTPLNDTDASNKLYVDNSSIKSGGTIIGNVILVGDLYVSGVTTTIDVGNLSIRDNIIILNSGETSDHVTLQYSGIEIDRGTGTRYRMVFNDTSSDFQVGLIGSLQSVATRQDTPNSSGVSYWNSTLKILDTNNKFKYNGTDLYISGMTLSGTSYLVYYDLSNGKLTYNLSNKILNDLYIDGNLYISGGTRNIILPKTSNSGIMVDIDNPTFGWKDLIGNISVKGTGPQNPTWAVYRTPIYQYQFSVNDECWNEFHIPHDYVVGTDLYIHIHWSHKSLAVSGGSVSWGFDISYSKGHNQSAFSTPFQTTVQQSASTTQYQHMIAEVVCTSGTPDGTHLDRNLIEIDGVILVRTILLSNTINGIPKPFVHYIDIHYQSNQMATKNKSPNFYG